MYTDDTDLDCIKYYHFASTQHLSFKKCTGTSNVMVVWSKLNIKIFAFFLI